MTAEPVGDLLGRVAEVNRQLPALLIELLNTAPGPEQAQQLREVGHLLGTLSAECLGRAAEVDGRTVEPVERVIIDVSGEQSARS